MLYCSHAPVSLLHCYTPGGVPLTMIQPFFENNAVTMVMLTILHVISRVLYHVKSHPRDS